jgi:hypothetical protein
MQQHYQVDGAAAAEAVDKAAFSPPVSRFGSVLPLCSRKNCEGRRRRARSRVGGYGRRRLIPVTAPEEMAKSGRR